MPGQGVADVGGQQLEEMASGSFQLHGQGDLVESPYPHLLPRALPLMEGPGSLDVIQQASIGRPGGWIQRLLPAVLEILRRHRDSVAPAHVVPQVEDVLASAFQHLPTAGYIGHDVHLWAQLHQPAEELVYHITRSDVMKNGRI